MRKKTTAELLEEKRRLDYENALQRQEINLLDREIKFFQTNSHLITTGIIAIEKMTDVIAHVIADLRYVKGEKK